MTRKISAFAIMACLATSFAFAEDNAKCASSTDNAKAEATQTATTDKNVAKDSKKNQNNAKPAPSTQDREFDKVLQGIYG
jgi:hypothetical protein